MLVEGQFNSISEKRKISNIDCIIIDLSNLRSLKVRVVWTREEKIQKDMPASIRASRSDAA